MPAKKPAKKSQPKGPRGPALTTITVKKLLDLLKGDMAAEIQVSRRSVLLHIKQTACDGIDI